MTQRFILEQESGRPSIRTIQVEESESEDGEFSALQSSVHEAGNLNEIPIFSPNSSLDGIAVEHRKNWSQPTVLPQRKSHGELTCLDFLAALKGEDTTRISKGSCSGEITTRVFEFAPLQLEPLHEYGPHPTIVYCRRCSTHVHSQVKFIQTSKIPRAVLQACLVVFGCCGLPLWLEKYRTHTCPYCGETVGKTFV